MGKRIAFYIKDDENTIKELEEGYKAKYAPENGIEYVGLYADLTSDSRHRTELKRLLADAHEHKMDMVVTKNISRFGRNILKLTEVIKELCDLGIEVYFEEENLSTASADTDFLLKFMKQLAVEETKEKTKYGRDL